VANKKMAPFTNKNKSEQFEVIGISVDTDKQKWNNAIVKDKLRIHNLYPLNGAKVHFFLG
jgi:hypothetical protein